MDDAKREMTLRDLRHNFYDWLQSMGVPDMQEGGKNRTQVFQAFTMYANAHNFILKNELFVATRSNEERNKARKEKAKRKAEQAVQK